MMLSTHHPASLDLTPRPGQRYSFLGPGRQHSASTLWMGLLQLPHLSGVPWPSPFWSGWFYMAHQCCHCFPHVLPRQQMAPLSGKEPMLQTFVLFAYISMSRSVTTHLHNPRCCATISQFLAQCLALQNSNYSCVYERRRQALTKWSIRPNQLSAWFFWSKPQDF